MKVEDFVEKYKEHFQNSFHRPDDFGYQVYVSEEWLDKIDKALTSLFKWGPTYTNFQIHQIKEKFGGLRFYYRTDDDNLARMLDGLIIALEAWVKEGTQND